MQIEVGDKLPTAVQSCHLLLTVVVLAKVAFGRMVLQEKSLKATCFLCTTCSYLLFMYVPNTVIIYTSKELMQALALKKGK